MKRFLLLVVSFLSFAASAWGSPLSIDVTASSCEIESSDTIRVRYISIPSMGVTAWADFKWDGNSYMFVPVNANYDTLSVVGDWMFTVDNKCDSSTNSLYLRLNSDHTITCTPTSAYDSSCKTNPDYSGHLSGTWSLSGSTLVLYITDSGYYQLYSDTKLTGTLNGTVSYNGILDGKMYKKDSTTYDYTSLFGCFSATRVTP